MILAWTGVFYLEWCLWNKRHAYHSEWGCVEWGHKYCCDTIEAMSCTLNYSQLYMCLFTRIHVMHPHWHVFTRIDVMHPHVFTRRHLMHHHSHLFTRLHVSIHKNTRGARSFTHLFTSIDVIHPHLFTKIHLSIHIDRCCSVLQCVVNRCEWGCITCVLVNRHMDCCEWMRVHHVDCCEWMKVHHVDWCE